MNTFSAEWYPGVFQTVLDEAVVQERLTQICHELKKLATEIYLSAAAHPYTEPPTYTENFEIEDVTVQGRKGKALVNSDPVWVFVEYGAHHPRSGEEIEGWAPMRRAGDILSSRVGG